MIRELWSAFWKPDERFLRLLYGLCTLFLHSEYIFCSCCSILFFKNVGSQVDRVLAIPSTHMEAYNFLNFSSQGLMLSIDLWVLHRHTDNTLIHKIQVKMKKRITEKEENLIKELYVFILTWNIFPFRFLFIFYPLVLNSSDWLSDTFIVWIFCEGSLKC